MTADVQSVWIPGELHGTNRALDDLRAAGYYEGVARARWGRPPRGSNWDLYVSAARGVRLAAKAAARGLRKVGKDDRVVLDVRIYGHDRLDTAAAYLPAKWAEDGLVDAGVIPSDRFNVAEIVFRVVRGDPDRRRGMLIVLRPEGAPWPGV